MADLFQSILSIDKDLFVFLNGFHSSFWDNFFWLFSGKFTFLLFYIALIYFVVKTSKWQAVWVLLGVIIVVALADQTASSLLKPWVQRLRPSHEPSLEGIVHLFTKKGGGLYRGGLYGFASSHAANAFGVGTFIALVYRNKFVSSVILAWAVVTACSRIYLGVHYPLDVLCGGAIGAFFATATYLTALKTNLITKKQPVAAIDAYIVSGALLFTVIIFLFFGSQLALYAK